MSNSRALTGVDDIAVGGDVGEGLGPVLLHPWRGPHGPSERRLALRRFPRRQWGRRGGVDVHGSGGGGSRHGKRVETLELGGGIVGNGWRQFETLSPPFSTVATSREKRMDGGSGQTVRETQCGLENELGGLSPAQP